MFVMNELEKHRLEKKIQFCYNQSAQKRLWSIQPVVLLGSCMSQLSLVLSQLCRHQHYGEITVFLTIHVINIPRKMPKSIKTSFVCNCWFIISCPWGFQNQYLYSVPFTLKLCLGVIVTQTAIIVTFFLTQIESVSWVTIMDYTQHMKVL